MWQEAHQVAACTVSVLIFLVHPGLTRSRVPVCVKERPPIVDSSCRYLFATAKLRLTQVLHAQLTQTMAYLKPKSRGIQNTRGRHVRVRNASVALTPFV